MTIFSWLHGGGLYCKGELSGSGLIVVAHGKPTLTTICGRIFLCYKRFWFFIHLLFCRTHSRISNVFSGVYVGNVCMYDWPNQATNMNRFCSEKYRFDAKLHQDLFSDDFNQVLVELAELQDREVGDGTTSVVIIASELLKVTALPDLLMSSSLMFYRFFCFIGGYKPVFVSITDELIFMET